MTRSELLTVLSTGMATAASTTLGIYVLMLSKSFPNIAGHLLSASVIAIPASIVISKLLLPETETPETLSAIPPEAESSHSRNLMSAIIEGANDGLKLAIGIATLLVAGCDQFARRLFPPPAISHHAPHSIEHGRNQTDIERSWMIVQETHTAPAHEQHVAARGKIDHDP